MPRQSRSRAVTSSEREATTRAAGARVHDDPNDYAANVLDPADTIIRQTKGMRGVDGGVDTVGFEAKGSTTETILAQTCAGAQATACGCIRNSPSTSLTNALATNSGARRLCNCGSTNSFTVSSASVPLNGSSALV